MPKSVKSPVKWVVLTLASEILVTNEFCKPMAKSKLNAMRLGLFWTNTCPNKATANKIRLSIIIGIIKIKRSFFRVIISTKRLETNDPKKKNKI